MVKILMRCLCLFFLLLFATNVYSQDLMGTEDNQVRVLSADDNSVVLEVVMGSFDENGLPFSVASVELGGQTFNRLVLKGLAYIIEEGKPQLPMKGVLLQIPHDAQVGLRVESKEAMTYSGYRIPPVTEVGSGKWEVGMRRASPDSRNPATREWQEGKRARWQNGNSPLAPLPFFDTEIYSRDAFYPQHPAEIQILGFLRDVRVANVSVYPIQYNPIRNDVKFHRRLQLTVSFRYSNQSLSQSQLSQAPSVGSRNAVKVDTTDLIDARGQISPHSSIRSVVSTSYAATEHPDFQQIYRDLIVNFNPNAQPVKSIPSRAPQKENTSTGYKLIVDQDGIYCLTYQDLKQAGIDVAGINPKTLKLTNKGKTVPLLVSGEKDGVFDPIDYIEFQGEFNRGTYSLLGEYTTENVYWLSWGEELGARMAIKDATSEDNNSITNVVSYRAVAHFEQDNFRGSLGYVDEKRDLWFWANMSPGIHQYPFELHDIQKNTESIIRIMLHGNTLTNHRISVFVNGASLSIIRWHGQEKYLLEIPLDSILLKEGENILTLTLQTDTSVGDEDRVYLNWFEVEYWRAFRAQNNRIEFEIPNKGLSPLPQPPIPHNPLPPLLRGMKGEGVRGLYQFKIIGFTNPNIEIYKSGFSKLINVKIENEGVDEKGSVHYAAMFFDEIVQPTKYIALTTENKKKPKAVVKSRLNREQLHSSLNGADYIIIVYDDFYEDVLPLAKHRSKQFRVAVVKVQDIYDEFSWGLLTPEAIRAFIRYAYQYWRPPAPSYIFLVGDASWDFKKGKNYMPTYYTHTYKWGQTASDHFYVCVNGDDPLPDLFVGRITTRTKEETRAVVEKIIRYENNPLDCRLVIDDCRLEKHQSTIDNQQSSIPKDWRRHLLMLAAAGSFIRDSEQLLKDYVPIDLGYKVARVYTDPNSPYYGDTSQLLDFWNAGCSFVHFSGHGGGNIWADSKLFTLDDVKFLSNKNRLAFVSSFTCFTSYFDDPGSSGLNEKLVNFPEGGAIASLGSTGLGWVQGDYYMEQGLFTSLFRHGRRRVGQAIVETKVWMLLNTYHSLKVAMVSLFNLLGDAASVVPLPQQKIAVMAYLKEKEGEKWIQVRGVIDEKFNGQALVEVYRKEPTPEELQIYSPDYQTTLKVKNGRFSGQLVIPKSEIQIPNSVIRCYAWNEAEDADAVGATVLHVPGKDEIDFSIFADDIQFTSLPVEHPDEDGDIYPPVDGGVGGGAPLKVKLQATILNLGEKAASSVKVRFYSGPPFAGGSILGTATIPLIEGGQSATAEVDYTPHLEAETIYVYIDPLNEIVEGNKTNNTAEKKLMFNSYTIEPEGSLNNVISSLDGNLLINVPKGVVSAAVQLSVEAVAIPRMINQPDLQYAPLPQKANGGAYRLLISPPLSPRMRGDERGGAIDSGTFSISLTFRYDVNHPGNSNSGNLSVYRWQDDENLWEIATDDTQRKSGMVKATVNQLGLFSLLHNTDSLPPVIQLTLNDEQFAYDSVFASQTPTLSATIEDANGVGKVQVFMNGSLVKSEELSFSRSPSPSNATVVTFTPTLNIGDYLFAVEAADVNGNFAREELSFRVGGELKLLNVANHPNPFNPPADKETRFTYILTQPVEDVVIKIYSSSGRLIHQIQDASQRQGYNEVPWDGKDEDGEDLANGVYFYKIIVQTQEGKLSRIGKLAVIR